MNIVQKITSIFSKKSLTADMWWGLTSNNDRLAVQDLYRGIVYSCIDITAKKASTVPEYLYTGEGESKKKITTHPILDLLNKPNRYQTWFAFQYLLYSYLRGHGEVYILPVRSMSGKRVLEMYCLNPLDVYVVTGKTNHDMIQGYTHNGITYRAEDIIRIYNPNPYIPYRGVSPIEMARYDAEMDVKSMRWNNRIFENGANMSGLLSINTNDTEGFNRFSKQFRQNYTGVQNAGKIGVVRGDDVKFANFAINQKDMDFILQRKMSLERVLAIFQVPEIFLGMSKETKFSNASEVETIFNRDVIKPLLEVTFEGLNTWLVPSFGDRRIRLEYDNPVPEDREQALKMYDRGVNRWMTVNEVRQQLNMEPLDGEEYNTISTAPTIIPPPQENIKKKTLSEGLKDVYIKVTYNYYDEKEKEYTEKIKKHFNVLISAMKANRKAISSVDVDANMGYIYPDTTDWRKELYNLIFNQNLEIVQGAYQNNVNIFSLQSDFNLVNVQAIAYLQSKTESSVESIDNTTFEAVKRILTEEMGKDTFDLTEVKKRIAERIGGTIDGRTKNIVRSELIDSYNYGALQTYKKTGLEKKEWWTAEDERVCPWCRSLHGKVIDIDSNYTSTASENGKSATYISQHPKLHNMCRCTLLPVI